ncbi:MAG: DUF2339 domain-containing protein [Bacillota bacterium]
MADPSDPQRGGVQRNERYRPGSLYDHADQDQAHRNDLLRIEKLIGGSWVTWAGVGLVLMALGYFLKYAFDQQWLTPMIRVVLGVVAGCGLYGAGLQMLQRGYRRAYGLTFLGFGLAVVYTSVGAAYFALDLMSPAMGLLVMTGVTAVAVWSAWEHDSEALGAVALLGALVAPALFPEMEQFVLQRFAYVFAVAGGAVVLTIMKPWAWIRALAFAGVQVIYLGYLAMVMHPWKQGFGIAAGFFVLFALGLALESLWTRQRYSPWNLVLSLGNAIAFAVYAAVEIPDRSPVLTVTLLLCAAFYGGLALMIHHRVPEDRWGAMLHLLAAAALLTFTAPLRLGEVGITFAWTVEAVLLWWVGRRWRIELLQWSGPLLWAVANAYWLVVCWDVPWPRWFGLTYIPFVNPGALAWIALAAAGFGFSVWIERMENRPAFYQDLSTIFALVSHLIVGGLLTIQINNYFEAYPLASGRATYFVNQAALSVSWGVYALLLVGWGIYRRSPMFRWFGLTATGAVLLKVVFADLAGLETLVKMIALLVLGLIFLLIGFLYQRMNGNGTSAPQQ